MSDNIAANDFLETDLGNISPNPRGDYDDVATYEYLDLVVFQGGSYLCTAQTVTGISPQSGQVTGNWQLLTAPGDLTPAYIAMHDRVELDAQQVAIDRAAVALSRQEVSQMKDGITALHAEVLEKSELVEQNKDSAVGYAQAANVSRQAAEDARTDVSALVNGFDSHVATKTTEATGAITTARQAAVDVVQQQGTTSAQKVVTDTEAFITQKTDAAKTEIENTRDGVIQAVNMAGETQTGNVNTVGAAQVQAVNNAGTTQVQAVQTAGASYQAQIAKNTINIGDLRAFLGLENAEVAGITVDFANKTFTRLAGATGLTAGVNFDKWEMYGGRKRCNVLDDGTITAYYGDVNYKEDGSNGQVMVYQPKFYYLMYPIKLEPITPGIGYHVRKANYYVSDVQLAGFKLHPAFYDTAGNEIDYILMSAYEGSIFDVSANAYILDDAQVMDYANDLFCSIAGAKPASGKTQDLTRPKINQMCTNRGAGWYSDNIKATSANQMLMMIEMGMMNMQTAIGRGVVSVADNPNTENNSKVTGGTSALGNGTGQATGTSGQVSISYRGYENPWGNIWKFIYGMNIWGDGTLGGGVPYYATDFNFAESKKTDNYVSAGFSVTNAIGFVSAIGYSPECDWMFIGSEVLGNSSVPVGDCNYVTQNLNGYRVALLGSLWNSGTDAGAFYWYLSNGVGSHNRVIGGRLVYVPTATA